MTNTTTPQHLLHPGQVRHEVRETGERIEVVTTGTGAGALGRINEALSGTVWWLSMQNVKREVSKTPKDSTED